MTDAQISRRETIKLAAAFFGASAMTGCMGGGRGLADQRNYIDAHSHVWTPDLKRFPLGEWASADDMKPATFTAEELLAIAGPSGVSRVVLIQHGPLYGPDNSYLIDCARRFPRTFSIVALADERRPDIANHLRELKKNGVRGLRIGPGRYVDRTLVAEPSKWLEAKAMHNLWRIATDEGLVICPLISAEHLPTLEPMIVKFPGTMIAIDHFGHAERPEQMAQLAKLAKFPNVNIKVSAYYKFGDKKSPYDDIGPMIKSVYDAFGPDRMLWGSDCPYQLLEGNDYTASVALIESGLDFLTKDDRIKILRANSERLFF